MKLQIDTDNKTINILENVQFGVLIDILDKLFPNREWKSFTLITEVISKWMSPIIIDTPIYPPYPSYPWVTFDGTNKNGNLLYNTGTYNVDIK